jgi:thiol-disulfide isomerase/thioredoxin
MATAWPFISGSPHLSNVEDNKPANTAEISTSTDESPEKTLYNLADEYSDLNTDNVFVVTDADGIFKFIENGTGVLFLGYKECPACQEYVPMLDEIAKDHKISKIVYYDVRKSRLEDNENYQKLLDMLDKKGNFPEYNNDGEKRIFVPFLVTLDHGTVLFSDNETSHLNPEETSLEEYWTEHKAGWEQNVSQALSVAREAMANCTECSD